MAKVPYGDGHFLITYSTNVHAGETLDDLERIIRQDVAAVKARVFPDRPMGVNLRLGMTQARALQEQQARQRLRDALSESGCYLFTVNAFPLRDFHAPRVKDDVYRPSWRDPERADATIEVCRVLADLLPQAMVGTVSTLSGQYAPRGDSEDDLREMARQFARVVVELERLYVTSGREIVLGLEPEPFTTAETVGAFADYYRNHLLPMAVDNLRAMGLAPGKAETAARRHLGINVDLCHQAVEFEDPLQALQTLEDAGIRIASLHISAALSLPDPHGNPAGLERLRRYAEPRYLHQTFGADAGGNVVLRLSDLSDLKDVPPEVHELRTHFHLPLFLEEHQGLRTTAPEMIAAVRYALDRGLTDQLILETYTWNVILSGDAPAGAQVESVHEGIAREFAWVLERLKS